jgi:hypothetical protein
MARISEFVLSARHEDFCFGVSAMLNVTIVTCSASSNAVA